MIVCKKGKNKRDLGTALASAHRAIGTQRVRIQQAQATCTEVHDDASAPGRVWIAPTGIAHRHGSTESFLSRAGRVLSR